jgi:CHAT domain-containing protein/Tfp pilus assembly protein PilF
MGSLEAGIQRYREALAITYRRLELGLGHRDRQWLSAFAARLHHSLGVAAFQLGQLELAKGELRQALAVYAGLDPDVVQIESGQVATLTGSTHTALGSVLTELGDLRQAHDQHLQAYELAQATEDTPLVANSLNNLGLTLIRTGELDRAAAYLQRALPLIRDDPTLRREGEAACLTNLGLCYRLLVDDRGDDRLMDQALGWYEQAVESARRFGPSYPDLVVALSNIAEIRIEREEWPHARRTLSEALQISEQVAPSSRRTAILLNHMGTTQARTSQLDQAAHSFERAARILEASAPHSEEALQAVGNLASVHHEQGRLDLAIDLADRATQTAESLRTRVGHERARQRIFTKLQPPYDTLVAALYQRNAAGDHERAFQAAEQSKARTLVELLAGHDVTLGAATSEQRALEQDDRELRVRYANVLDRLVSAGELADDARTSEQRYAAQQTIAQLTLEEAALSEQLDRVRQQLGAISPAYAELHYPVPLTLPELQQHLDERTLVLAYQLTSADCYLWAVRRRAFAMLELAGMHDWADTPTENDAVGWSIVPYQHWEDSDIRARATDIAAAQAVASRLLLHPVPESLLAGATHLVVIPHGRLAYLPFELLPIADGRLVIDDLTVGYAPSATVLVNRWQAARRQPPSWRHQTFAGFGPATVPLPAPDGELAPLPPLPAAERVRSWAERFDPSGVAFVGGEATRGTVEATGGYRFVHFATHAFFDEREPLRSELVLATAPSAGPDRDPSDGRLRAAELFGLSLDAEVVTCAGCSTGLGELVHGEGVLGFVQALFHAGARCVVVSLWPVHDQPAARLMERFYDALRDDRSPAEALRAAKLAMRQQYPQIYQDAYDWAGFVAVGAAWDQPQRMEM